MNLDKQIVIIDAEAYTNLQHDLNDLAKLLEDVISDCYNVKGAQQVRHSYILYRDRVDTIKNNLKKARINEQQ